MNKVGFDKALEEEGSNGIVDLCLLGFRVGDYEVALEYMLRLKIEQDWGYSSLEAYIEDTQERYFRE